MESIWLGFRLEADSVRLDLRISSRGLVRLEPRLVDRADGADGADYADRLNKGLSIICYGWLSVELLKNV